MSRYSATLLGVGSLIGLSVAAANAAPITGASAGVDDWFWGTSIGQLNNIGTGANTAFVGELIPAVVSDWLANPGTNYGVAMIGVPPSYYTNACMFSPIGTWRWADMPGIDFNSDNSNVTDWKINAGLTDGTGGAAMIKKEDPAFNDHTSATYNTVNGGPHPVLWKFGLTPFHGNVNFAKIHAGAPYWAEANLRYNIFKMPVNFDQNTITYGNLIPPYIWQGAAAGNWGDANWGYAPGAVQAPNAFGAVAKLGTKASAPVTVSLTGDQTVGQIQFDSPNAYTIQRAGSAPNASMAFDGPVTAVVATQGNHVINMPMDINSTAAFDVAANASVTVNGRIWYINSDGAASPKYPGIGAWRWPGGVVKTSPGKLVISNPTNDDIWGSIDVGSAVMNGGGQVNPGGTVQLKNENSTYRLFYGQLNNLKDTNPTSPTYDKYAGLIDIGNNKIIAYTGGTPIGQVSQMIAAARHPDAGGVPRFDMPGLGSSLAGSEDQSWGMELYTVGAARNGDYEFPKTTFGGKSVGNNDIMVRYTYGGDANLDGKVDGDDYTMLDNGFWGLNFDPNDPTYTTLTSYWIAGDFNYDGVTDANDYVITDNAYWFQSGPLGKAVPEPASLGLLGVAGLLALRRRSR